MKVFLSHANEDVHIAGDICRSLEAEGCKPFLAGRDVSPGKHWPEELVDTLEQCEAIVVLITPRSLNRPWVLAECGIAWAMRKKIFPLTQFVSPADVPGAIGVANVQATAVESAAQLASAIARIVEELRRDRRRRALNWPELVRAVDDAV